MLFLVANAKEIIKGQVIISKIKKMIYHTDIFYDKLYVHLDLIQVKSRGQKYFHNQTQT